MNLSRSFLPPHTPSRFLFLDCVLSSADYYHLCQYTHQVVYELIVEHRIMGCNVAGDLQRPGAEG